MPKVLTQGDVKARAFEEDLNQGLTSRGRSFELRAVDAGENSAYIHNALIALDLPPVNPYDANQVEDRIREYFEFCLHADKVPNMVGMANWLGVSKAELDRWKRGDTTDKEKYKIVQRMLTVFEELMIDYAQNQKGNPALSIFLLKNWFGYRDMQETVVVQQNPIGEAAQAADLADKYLNLDGSPAIDTEFAPDPAEADVIDADGYTVE